MLVALLGSGTGVSALYLRWCEGWMVSNGNSWFALAGVGLFIVRQMFNLVRP
jgi:hypothetical protein